MNERRLWSVDRSDSLGSGSLRSPASAGLSEPGVGDRPFDFRLVARSGDRPQRDTIAWTEQMDYLVQFDFELALQHVDRLLTMLAQ